MNKIDLGAVTAYAMAVAQGYEGTEEEFAALLANSGNKTRVKAYSGYRHEIHNELELRDEVEDGLIAFINDVLEA